MMGFQLLATLMFAPMGRPRYEQGNFGGWKFKNYARVLVSVVETPIPNNLLLEKLTFSQEAKLKHLKMRQRYLSLSIDHFPKIRMSSANWR